MTADQRRSAPAAERNLGPILAALVPRISDLSGVALEIGSGTGQHIASLASRLPALVWQPSDLLTDNFPSIEAWAEESGGQIRPPVEVDAASLAWPITEPLALLFAFNVIHITPWPLTERLIAGAKRHLQSGGRVILYGPFRENGCHTAPTNAEFDEWLKARNPSFGVRDVEDVEALAVDAGLLLHELVPMPANNRLVIFAKP